LFPFPVAFPAPRKKQALGRFNSEVYMEFITQHYQDILAIIGAVVSLATLIVGLTPTTKDDEILGKIVRVLDYFSVLPVKK